MSATKVARPTGSTQKSPVPLTYLTSTRTTLRQNGALLRKAASNELARGSAETAEALTAVAKTMEDAAND